jgi:ubiquinone/menaquinone biosynthesis C-methylase UbiE
LPVLFRGPGPRELSARITDLIYDREYILLRPMSPYGLSCLTPTTPLYKRVYCRLFGRPHTWSRGPLVVEHIQPQAGERILEIGCRGGVLSSELAAGGADVIAVDIDSIKIGYEIKADSPVLERLHFTLADAYRLPFASAAFHKIAISECLEHLEDDFAALEECMRVLGPGGRLIMTVPTVPGYPPHRLFARLVALIPEPLLVRGDADNPGRTFETPQVGNHGHLLAHADNELILKAFGHYRHYDEDSLTSVLTRAGFRIERLQRYQMLFESEMMYFERCVRGMRSPLIYPVLRMIASLDRFLPRTYPGVGLLAVASR